MYKIADIQKKMFEIADEAAKHVDLLAELDGLSGDGDLGETIGKLTKEVIKKSDEEFSEVGVLFMKTAMAMNKAAPSTLGTLLSSGVMALAKACKGKTELIDEDIISFPRIFADAIKEKGHAEIGDKTILDALYPMAFAAEKEFEVVKDLKQSFKAGGKAAIEGAEHTRGMIPKSGRAQWIGERVKDNLDGGAVLCAKVAEVFI